MRYIATKSRTRHYGFTVQDTTGKDDSFIGPQCTGGWYKLKRHAEQRAYIMNKAHCETCLQFNHYCTCLDLLV